MDLRGKILLVIGGAGLIGSHTVDALLGTEAAEIRIFDNFSSGREENIRSALRDPRVHVFELGGEILHRDILDAAMRGVDGVFHFAGVWLLHCQDYPRTAFEVNVGGTFNVLEAMVNNGVKRLVFSSSASVYGDAVEEPMTEDHPYRNETFYGATKIAGEQICRALFARYLGTERRFDYVALRYMNVYGPRQVGHGAYASVITQMLSRIERGLPPTVHGDGSQAFDFVDVSDCARANVCAMHADATNECYNVASGTKTTIQELARMLLDLSDSSLEIEYGAMDRPRVRTRVGSQEKARVGLGFVAEIGLREGLRKLIDWRRLRPI